MKNLIIFFLLFHYFSSNAQIIDTNLLLLNAKMSIVDFNNVNKGKNDLLRIIEHKPKVIWLKSTGFRNYIFFSINLTGLEDTFYDNINYESDFIFAYNYKVNLLYNLKGQRYNQFESFLRVQPNQLDVIALKYLKSRKFFVEYFYIEGLDMDCLYRSINKKNKQKYLCLKPSMKEYTGYSH